MAKRRTTHRAASRRAKRRNNARRAWIIFGTLGRAALGFVLLSSGILSPRPDPVAEKHPHAPAIHGGMLVSVGDDQEHYHVEIVLTRSGILRLYMLAADAAKVVEVDLQAPTAQLRAAGMTEPVPVQLRAVPRAGDSPGKTSQFLGRLPWGLRGKALAVTVPELAFAHKRFPVRFELRGSMVVGDMPAHRDDEEKLLRTPGGKYTAADIQANGNTTASAKFKKVKPRHDERPQPGDPVCPLTGSKARSDIAWIVGGKSYQFCCPPCIDEFVMLAKELPEEIEDPEAYVEKK